jgi:hypothetical protein
MLLRLAFVCIHNSAPVKNKEGTEETCLQRKIKVTQGLVQASSLNSCRFLPPDAPEKLANIKMGSRY